MNINWEAEVEKRKESLIKDTQQLLRIKSVRDMNEANEDAPLGIGVKEALQFMLDLGEKDGFSVKNVDNLAGHIEFGAGEECVGILCHVDVVPEGDGWSFPPFEGTIYDGKIYARGAIDDKGPTMAAYYGMKIVKELSLPLSRRVRMIIGTDEESDWQCVDHYFKHEEMPTFGFAPDANFPIIHAEKGISDIDIVQKNSGKTMNGNLTVLSFIAGRRYNMVPDDGKAILSISEDKEKVINQYETYLKKNNLSGSYHIDQEKVVFELKGLSAHGMEPDKGINAGIYLATFINSLPIDDQAKRFFNFIHQYFYNDSRGEKLGVAYADNITGDLTINVGILSYQLEEGGKLGLNLRYPVTNDINKTKEKLIRLSKDEGFIVEKFTDSKPHYVDENDFLVRTLQRVYEEQTGEKGELLAIGGGTYARSLQSGVAFGPLFPGRPDVAHQKDEHIFVEDLLKATAIYAQAIYELAR